MKAKDIMSTPVIAIGPETLLRDIVGLLLEKHISGVPVVADGAVVGVVNESDLLRRFEIGTDNSAVEKSWWAQVVDLDKLPTDYVKSHARRARDIMTSPVTTVTEDASIQSIASMFAARHIRRIPVVRGASLVGVVTRADLVRAIALKTDFADLPSEQSDEAIELQLTSELERQRWWHPVSSTIHVQGGVVHFRGLFENEDCRRAARIAAENVPGVRRVEDQRIPTSSFQAMF